MHRTLRDLGEFRPEDTVLLRGEDTETVRRVIIRVNERLRAEASDESLLLVYYSGHGDATSLHLGETRFGVDELEGLVRGSSAHTRVLIVDACRSGSLTRVKGATPAPPVDIQLQHTETTQGAVFLTSSAANEDAQESDEIRGSFFTHYFVSALLGVADADHDGRVTLGEAYAYAYRSTLRASSRSLAGLQHPTFAYELKGHEDIALTLLSSGARSGGALVFPPDRTFLLMSGGPEGGVVAELTGEAKVRRVFLPAGRYFVRGRGQVDLVEGHVDVAPNETRSVDESTLTKVAYARLVRKGHAELTRVQGVHAGYLTGSGLWSGASWCHGVFAAYEVVTRELSLAARLSGCRGGFTNDTVVAHVDEFGVQIEGARVWDLPFISLQLGLALGASALSESFDTRGSAPSRTALAGTLEANAGVEVPLIASWVLHGTGGVDVHAFQQRDATPTSQWVTPVSLVIRAGVGARW
jgi:hypothetical protein